MRKNNREHNDARDRRSDYEAQGYRAPKQKNADANRRLIIEYSEHIMNKNTRHINTTSRVQGQCKDQFFAKCPPHQKVKSQKTRREVGKYFRAAQREANASCPRGSRISLVPLMPPFFTHNPIPLTSSVNN